MKTKLQLLVVILMGLLQGCAVLAPDGNVTPERLAATAKSAAYFGTALYLLEKPLDGPLFEKAAGAIDVLLIEGDLDPVKLHAVLAALGEETKIKELHGPEAIIVIQAAMIIWEASGTTLDIDKAQYVGPVAAGLRDGIKLALAAHKQKGMP